MSVFSKNMDQRARKAIEVLILRIKTRLEDMLAIAFSAYSHKTASTSSQEADDANAKDSSKDKGNADFPERSFSHCLRALVMLQRGRHY